MTNKLTIEAELNADGVTKGIDEIDNKLQKLESSAVDSQKKGEQATKSWGSAFDKLGESMPTTSDASGIDAIATAATGASGAAKTAQSAFARFGESLKSIGGSALNALKSGLASAGTALANLGRTIGTAFGRAIDIGIKNSGTFAALILLAAAAMAKLLDFAKSQGAKFMAAYTGAFKAGLDLSAFNSLRAAFTGMLDAKATDDAANALGKLFEAMREGGKDADAAQAAIEKLGGNFADLQRGGEGTLRFLTDIQGAFKELDTLAQRQTLEKLFPDAKPETLAQIAMALNGTTEALTANISKINEANAAYATAQASQKAMGEAYDAFWKSLSNLGGAFAEAMGWSKAYTDTMAAMPNILTSISSAMDATAGKLREFAAFMEPIRQSAQQTAQAITEFGKAMGSAIVDTAGQAVTILVDIARTFAALAAIAWDGISAGINAIGDALGKIVTAAQSAIQYIKDLIAQLGELASRAKNAFSFSGWFGGGAEASPQSFNQAFNRNLRGINSQANAAPVMALRGGFMPLADNGQSNIMALSAANSNSSVGAIFDPSAMNTAIQQMKELTKQAERAGTAMGQLGTVGQTAVDGLVKGMESFGDSAAGAFADAIVDGGNLADTFKSLAKQMAKMVLEALVLKPLMNSIFGGLGGGFSSPLSAGLMGQPATTGLTGASPLSASLGASNDLSGLANIAGRRAGTRLNAVGNDVTVRQTANTWITIDSAGQSVVDSDKGPAFAKAVDAAVQQVLVREARPGGLLWKGAA